MSSSETRKLARIRIRGGRIRCTTCSAGVVKVVLLKPDRPHCAVCARNNETVTTAGTQEHQRGSSMNTVESVFDRQLQMFVEPPHEADLAHLHFLRWLVEHGRLEHETAGSAVGEYAASPIGAVSSSEPQRGRKS